MSASSIATAARDPQLAERVAATANKEVRANDALSDTVFGRAVAAGNANYQPLMWAVAVSTEAAYETALLAGRGAPGHDTDIITDADLTAAVVAGWPPDPELA